MLHYKRISYSIRTLIFTFVLVVKCISPTQAQSTVGLQFGRCYSKFDVVEGSTKFQDFSEDYDHQGLAVKTFYSYSFIKQLSIKQNIGYEKRGAIIKRDYGWVGFDKFSFNYLNLSTSLSLRPIKYLSFYCGINYNYLIKAIGYYGKNGSGTITESYNRIDIGYDIGSTINVKGFFIEASFFKSIKPFASYSLAVINPSLKSTEYWNNSLEFSIGYQMEMNKIIKRNKKDKK